MGKKSLTKSTTKKKAKKTSTKNTKKTATKNTTAKKVVTKAAAKKTAVKKGTPKKSAMATKKKITLKDLIFKKFDTWKPEEFFKVEIDKDALKAYAAPPFITGSSDDTERIKEILFRKFDPETMRKQIEELKAVAEKEAAEKAAMEKAEAERKAAEEKAAKEKAEAERKAAEEKAAAEKAEAEKKAAAEKEAAEKAAKEKAEAEKKAAEEKAAKEKAEAEKKAAMEKAEAEKQAALERAASEKVAAEEAVAKKAAAEKKAVEMKRNIIAAGAGLAIILLMLIGASFSNMSNFYLKPAEGGIEIWRGSFAPMGQKKYFALQGVELQEPAKKVYSKEDVYPLIFHFYIEQADSLLEVQPLPDFDGIKHNLDNALNYGVTAELRETAQNRLNMIDFMILVYKADIAAEKASLSSLNSAMSYYKEAAGLNPAEDQAEQLKQKIESVLQKISLLEQQAAIAADKEAIAGAEEEGVGEEEEEGAVPEHL
ncbi:MAG: hypothetical protein JJV92_09915 [Desulfosarcina sp.]|nr:hypothetical protein [Desulfobacterales bacterium]